MAHVNPIQIQKYLKGVDYPASKAALLEKARSMGADENVCASIEQLPDEDFQTPAEVSQAFGKLPDEDAAAGEPAAGKAAAGKAGKETAGDKPPKRPAHAKEEAAAKPQRRHSGGNEFVIEAMQNAMAEIQICEMAIEKSQNEDAKKFAQAMIDEHGRLGRELEQLAAKKKLDVPGEIRPEQKMTADELGSLSGRDFEQRWIQYNIDVHERDTKVFSHYAAEEDDPDIRDMAKHGADRMRKHLKMAHDVGKKLAKP
jgi:predicted outer membrane protein